MDNFVRVPGHYRKDRNGKIRWVRTYWRRVEIKPPVGRLKPTHVGSLARGVLELRSISDWQSEAAQNVVLHLEKNYPEVLAVITRQKRYNRAIHGTPEFYEGVDYAYNMLLK